MKGNGKLRALKALAGRNRRREGVLTDREAREAILAYRRGVTAAQLADTLGCARGAVYAYIGIWAMKSLKV